MTELTIPPEALEAAARDVATVMGHDWETLSEDDRDVARSISRAANLAMLKAWPRVHEKPYWDFRTHERFTELILPLPQEVSDE